MMKKYMVLFVLMGASVAFGGFTDINSPQYEGKTGDKARNTAIDANFDILEGTAGTANGATVSATENAGALQSTVITLSDTPVVVTEQGAGTNAVGGVKIYDFPEGRILVLGVTVDSVIIGIDTNAIDAADGGDWSFGTAVPGVDGTLDGTAVDLCPATSADPIVSTNSSALVASAQFDGTTTAKDMYFNMLIDDADVSATHTNTIDATVTINWINLGDY